MKPLSLELTKGNERQFQSIGWKTPKDGDCRRQFFALDQHGKALVVTPTPAMPQSYDPGKQAPAIFTCEPFPEAVCIKISPCRLLPPPCYQSRKEFESLVPCLPTFDPWRAVYLQTHNQVLFLETADDNPLQERLDKWLVAMRATCEQEVSAWRDKINRAATAPLQELGFDTEEQRAKELVELQTQLDTVESENPISGVPCKGRLKLTLADVKNGDEGIRDAWMHENWAKKNGEDLREMSLERQIFRKWLVTHTGTRATVHDMTARERRQGTVPPEFGDKYENQPQFLEACAQVRYRARFADNANTVVYLADCEMREELTAEERDELAKLTVASNQPTQQAALTPPPVPDPQFEYVNVQGTEWRKAGPQMVRRRELAEHQRTTKDDSAFRKLLDAHRERWFYLTKQIAEACEAAKVGKNSRVAAMFDITDWDSNWHPPGKPSWLHPGRKSESFRTNQS